MFHLLPIELVFDIIQIAAYERVASDDLPSAVQLALLSRDVHALVVPIVYHTLFITALNCKSLRILAGDAASSRCLGAVRLIFVARDVYEDDAAPIFRACPIVTCIYSTPRVLRGLKQLDHVQPTRVVLFQTLDAASFEMRCARVTQRTTHIQGYYMPVVENPPASTWVVRFLDALPALTHVAVIIAGFIYRSDNHDVLLPRDDIADFVRALLQRPQMRQVVVRLSGSWLAKRDALALHLARLGDARVIVCADARPYRTWDDEVQLCADDVRRGVDVWTSAAHL